MTTRPTKFSKLSVLGIPVSVLGIGPIANARSYDNVNDVDLSANQNWTPKFIETLKRIMGYKRDPEISVWADAGIKEILQSRHSLLSIIAQY